MAVKKSVGASDLKNSINMTMTASEEDAHMESAALIEELKERVQRTEEASEEYKKQVEVLQSRLDEAVGEQGKLEDKLHEEEERIEGVENDKRELLRQKREIEGIYEAERVAAMKERESSQAREEEMQTVIQRLKESLSQREEGRLSRTGMLLPLHTYVRMDCSLTL
jgi:chromosome segregation ATPase